MTHLRKILTSICLCLIFSLSSSINAQDIKGIYINDFKYILGDSSKEKTLLEFVKDQGFNYVLLYNLRYISDNLYDLTELETANILANFIRKAKEEYGVDAVGAVGQKFSSFTDIDLYNQLWSLDDIRKIDVYHMEFEYWNKNFLASEWESTNKAAAFEYYLDQMHMLKNICLQRQVKCESYMGNATSSQCELIGELADRVLVHYYRKSDVYKNGNSIYQYKSYRLPALAPSGDKVLEVIPVFSARSYFMGPWLEEHPMEQAYDTYLFGQNAYASQEGDWKNHINIQGYQWYRYTDLETILNNLPQAMVASISDDPQTQTERENGSHYRVEQETKKVTVESFRSINEVKVYPQPANKLVRLETNQAIKSIDIFDMLGRKLELLLPINESKKIEITTAHWKPGMYFIYLTNAKENTMMRKILIQH